MKKNLVLFLLLLACIRSVYSNTPSSRRVIRSGNDAPGDTVYVAGNTNDIEADKTEAVITGGIASNFQPGNEIKYSYDNDFTTGYHSDWSGGGFPIVLTYTLAPIDSINFLEYYPRQDYNINGNFGRFELFYSMQGDPDNFISVGGYDFGGSPQASLITFGNALIKPAKMRLIIFSGANNFASCAEIKFLKKSTSVIPNVFTDITCSQLQAWVTDADIDTMANAFYRNIAAHIADGQYQSSFRTQSYQPYPTIQTTAAKLKIGTYNSFENPTGIVFKKNEEVVLFVSNAVVKPLHLTVVNMVSGNLEASSYLLSSGINKIMPQTEGLGYISYYYDDYGSLPAITINIAGGMVNGYFDISKHTNTDWAALLGHAVYGSFDIVGKEVSLCYTTGVLKDYTPSDGVSFINLYDSIVHLEHDQMGLVKYNRLPKNRMFATTTATGGWRTGGLGSEFALDWGADNVTDVAGVRAHMWGIAHEFGHENQIRPDLLWVGTGEVTNNMYSVWCSYNFGSGNVRRTMETEPYDDGFGNNVSGGRINAFLNEGVVKGKKWQLQLGGDPFVKLAPLWQLMIYYQLAGKGNNWYKPDWFKDLAERMRNTNSVGLSDGRLQLNFIKNTCDVVGEDLTDFFKKAGMLQPIDSAIDGASRLTITQAACDSITAYASKYRKPSSPVIYYLSLNSVAAYQHKASITGIAGAGVTFNGGACRIDHNQWKNIAAFETYKNDTLLRADIYGLGSTDNSFTTMELSDTAVEIYAVGWDGTKKLVYPAPIVLSLHTITLQANAEGTSVKLSWYAISEMNVAGYEVQRSSNGQSYVTIAEVAATGKNGYSYSDNDAAGELPNYYRIKMVSNDGTAAYSNIVPVTLKNRPLTVYPVPFMSLLNVQLQNTTTIREVRLIDMASGSILRPSFKQQNITLNIQIANLAAGPYVLELTDVNGQRVTIKVIKLAY